MKKPNAHSLFHINVFHEPYEFGKTYHSITVFISLQNRSVGNTAKLHKHRTFVQIIIIYRETQYHRYHKL